VTTLQAQSYTYGNIGQHLGANSCGLEVQLLLTISRHRPVGPGSLSTCLLLVAPAAQGGALWYGKHSQALTRIQDFLPDPTVPSFSETDTLRSQPIAVPSLLKNMSGNSSMKSLLGPWTVARPLQWHIIGDVAVMGLGFSGTPFTLGKGWMSRKGS
jgi:hypothetical protein